MADKFFPRLKSIGAHLRLGGLIFAIIIGTTMAIYWIKGRPPLEGLERLLGAIIHFFKAL